MIGFFPFAKRITFAQDFHVRCHVVIHVSQRGEMQEVRRGERERGRQQ